MPINIDQLQAALGDESTDAGISLVSELEPLEGHGATVKPAVYEGGVYQLDKRWWGGAPEPVDVVVIDNAPSQANRAEAALSRLQARLGLPTFHLDLSSVGDLPAHVSTSLTSFDFPHRQADAYFRDAILADTGEEFNKSSIGKALLESSAQEPEALLQWIPQALIYGFWQAHNGKKGVQTKFARAVSSEIVGYRPATTSTKQIGVKGDPLNLSTDYSVKYNPNDYINWELTESAKSKVKGEVAIGALSDIGHGQVPFMDKTKTSPGPISFQSIGQACTISFARLRTINTKDPAKNAAARALLAALGLVAFEEAFRGSFTLRSGCDLHPVKRSLVWRGAAGDEEMEPLGLDGALTLFDEAAKAAENLGLPVGSAWNQEPVLLYPQPKLVSVIRSTFAIPKK